MYDVPALSQYLDLDDTTWQGRACGVISLAMLLNYHGLEIDSNELLKDAFASECYLGGIGWKHKELARLAERFELQAKNFDWATLEETVAFEQMLQALQKGPILASIHHTFDPQKGGHLIVVTGLEDNTVFYNDPDAKERSEIKKSIPVDVFRHGWKKRIIEIER